jgi:23S rRNA pseudouridine955/2504/2580 synthase
VDARPITGRTHQIRVHAAHAGHAVLGDAKYSDARNEELAQRLGLRRLFLHAAELRFSLGERRFELEAPLDDELRAVLERAGLA